MARRLAGVAFCLWLGAMLSACSSAAMTTTPVTQSAAILPTWTPTALPVSSPTPTPDPGPALVSDPTPTPTFTPSASRTPAASAQRIDAAGPIAIPTIAPLPAGQGRSPVRLIIPVLGLDVRVAPMGWRTVSDARGVHTEWDVPDAAAGHHIDSAFPGEKGNVVISGHHNIGGAVFAPLSRVGEPDIPLKPGDEMIVEDELGRRFVYRVTGWRRFPEANASVALRRENASYLLPTDFPQLTLITCWPPESNTHRVIITGALTEIRTP